MPVDNRKHEHETTEEWIERTRREELEDEHREMGAFEDRCLDCMAKPCRCNLDGLDLEDQLDALLTDDSTTGEP